MGEAYSTPRQGGRLLFGLIGWLAALALLALVFLIWSVEATRPEWKILVATPEITWTALAKLAGDGPLWRATGATLSTWLVGFGIGAVAGLAIGVLAGSARPIESMLGPTLVLVGALPVPLLAFLMILWEGIGTDTGGRLAAGVLAFIAIAALTSHAQRGQATADRWTGTLRALEIGVVIALGAVVFAQTLASRDGLGTLAAQAFATFEIGQVFALLLWLWLLGVLLALPFAIARWIVGLAR